MPSGLEARLLAIVQASYLSQGQTESVRIRLAEARANGIIRWLGIKGLIGRVLVQPFTRNGSRYAHLGSAGVASRRWRRCSIATSRCW